MQLQAGTHVKVVSQQLGHASVKLTMDVYAHVLDEMHDDAAAKAATFLPSTCESIANRRASCRGPRRMTFARLSGNGAEGRIKKSVTYGGERERARKMQLTI